MAQTLINFRIDEVTKKQMEQIHIDDAAYYNT